MFTGNQTEILNEMYRYSDLIQSVNTPSEMNNLSISMSRQLEEIEVTDLNPFVLHSISHNLCSKFLVMYVDDFQFPDSAYYLLGLMFDRKMILPVYQSKLSALLSKKIAEKSGKLKPNSDILKKIQPDSSFKFNMDCFKGAVNGVNMLGIVNLDYKAERYINKRFGYSLLDLNGKFLWADDNSLKFFEKKPEELYDCTLFEMMIPHSKLFLKQKYGERMFKFDHANQSYGENICFSYVIYSKNSANKFVKQARKVMKRQPRIKKEVQENEDTGNKDSELYYTYLKSLSSKATLIALTFTKKELGQIMKNHGEKIDLVSKEERSTIENAEGEQYITKNAILMETRFSRSIPKFKFSELEGDPKIQELKAMIDIKMEKARVKREKKILKQMKEEEQAGNFEVKQEDIGQGESAMAQENPSSANVNSIEVKHEEGMMVEEK